MSYLPEQQQPASQFVWLVVIVSIVAAFCLFFGTGCSTPVDPYKLRIIPQPRGAMIGLECDFEMTDITDDIHAEIDRLKGVLPEKEPAWKSITLAVPRAAKWYGRQWVENPIPTLLGTAGAATAAYFAYDEFIADSGGGSPKPAQASTSHLSADEGNNIAASGDSEVVLKDASQEMGRINISAADGSRVTIDFQRAE